MRQHTLPLARETLPLAGCATAPSSSAAACGGVASTSASASASGATARASTPSRRASASSTLSSKCEYLPDLRRHRGRLKVRGGGMRRARQLSLAHDESHLRLLALAAAAALHRHHHIVRKAAWMLPHRDGAAHHPRLHPDPHLALVQGLHALAALAPSGLRSLDREALVGGLGRLLRLGLRHDLWLGGTEALGHRDLSVVVIVAVFFPFVLRGCCCCCCRAAADAGRALWLPLGVVRRTLPLWLWFRSRFLLL